MIGLFTGPVTGHRTNPKHTKHLGYREGRVSFPRRTNTPVRSGPTHVFVRPSLGPTPVAVDPRSKNPENQQELLVTRWLLTLVEGMDDWLLPEADKKPKESMYGIYSCIKYYKSWVVQKTFECTP